MDGVGGREGVQGDPGTVREKGAGAGGAGGEALSRGQSLQDCAGGQLSMTAVMQDILLSELICLCLCL